MPLSQKKGEGRGREERGSSSSHSQLEASLLRREGERERKEREGRVESTDGGAEKREDFQQTEVTWHLITGGGGWSVRRSN